MITPADGPAVPELYASVTPQGQGTAPYDVQAECPDLSATTDSAVALSGPGGPRQAMTEALLSSAQGYGEQDIDAGYAGSGEDSWPGNVEPGG